MDRYEYIGEIGLIVLAVKFVIEVLLGSGFWYLIVSAIWKRVVVPGKRQEWLNKAIEDRHRISGHLEKEYRDNAGRRIAQYRYRVEEKRLSMKMEVPQVGDIPYCIKLYYIKNPEKATMANRLGDTEIPKGKIFLCILLVACVLTAWGFYPMFVEYGGLEMLKGWF